MSEPKVGIFWGISAGSEMVLVIDTSLLAAGEPYGEFLTHPDGHCDVWETWQRGGAAALARAGLPTAILWHDYEQCPRGRVVYHQPTGLFTIYADPILQAAAMIDRIVVAFGLQEAAWQVRSDAHYRTRR